MLCCLCSGILGEDRPGEPLGDGCLVLCPEHRAQSIEQSRKPKPPAVPNGESRYLDACFAAALGGRPVKSLASLAQLVPPTSTTLQ
jgi:hypothetical protein